MRFLCFIAAILLMPLIGSMAAVVAQDWEEGENRIPNPDFEVDSAGAEPTGWTLEDGT